MVPIGHGEPLGITLRQAVSSPGQYAASSRRILRAMPIELTIVSQPRPPGVTRNSVSAWLRTIVTWAQKSLLEPLPTKIVLSVPG